MLDILLAFIISEKRGLRNRSGPEIFHRGTQTQRKGCWEIIGIKGLTAVVRMLFDDRIT
jgi:hypothetical protein